MNVIRRKEMYEIIIAGDVEVFEQRVNQALTNGYDLVGGPFIRRECFCQAVFKPRSRL